MHLQLLVLQAVLLNIATAGLIRSNRDPLRYASQLPPKADLTTDRLGIHARFQNSSSIPETILQPSTFSPTPTPSPVPFKAAQTPSEYAQSESAKPLSGQVGSVPAFGSGPGAATTESHKSASPPPTASSHRSLMKDDIQSSKPVLQTIPASIVQQTADYSEAGSASTQTPAVQKSVATSTSVTSAKTPLTNATAGTPTQQPAQSVSTKASAVSAGSQQSTATPNVPAGDNGNIAMALGFNSAYATMNAKTPCDANDKNQAVACVGGQYAQCSGGKYLLTACPQGQQCFALPLSKDFQGVTVQCASLQDASKKLGQSPSASPSTATATLSASPKSQQSIAKPTVTSTTSTTVHSTAVGSAKATVSHQTTFSGQQPTETPKESVTKSQGESGSPATPKTTSPQGGSQTPSPSPQTTTSAQKSDSPSPSPTRTTAAAQSTSDDPIIITPIPDSSGEDDQHL